MAHRLRKEIGVFIFRCSAEALLTSESRSKQQRFRALLGYDAKDDVYDVYPPAFFSLSDSWEDPPPQKPGDPPADKSVDPYVYGELPIEGTFKSGCIEMVSTHTLRAYTSLTYL